MAVACVLTPRCGQTAAAARRRRPGSGRRRSRSARRAASSALVGAQQHRVEAGALQQRQHVDQHVAGGADLARRSAARAQQAGLAVGAAVGPLRELQRDQRQPRQVGGQRLDVERRWPGSRRLASTLASRCAAQPLLEREQRAATVRSRCRTASASCLCGSMKCMVAAGHARPRVRGARRTALAAALERGDADAPRGVDEALALPRAGAR